MSISIDSMASMLDTTSANATKNYNANKLQNSLDGISSDTTESELKQVCNDFVSYFVEEIIKEVKENMTSEEDDKDNALATMTDFNMDSAIETIADEVVDEVGESFTQQLYEQMKRNYRIE